MKAVIWRKRCSRLKKPPVKTKVNGIRVKLALAALAVAVAVPDEPEDPPVAALVIELNSTLRWPVACESW